MTGKKTTQALILCPKCDNENLIIKEKHQPLVTFRCGNSACSMDFYVYVGYLPLPKFLFEQERVRELQSQRSARDIAKEFPAMPVSKVIM